MDTLKIAEVANRLQIELCRALIVRNLAKRRQFRTWKAERAVLTDDMIGQAFRDNVTVVDRGLCLLRVTLDGWARLVCLNRVDDVGVHSGQQALDDMKGLPLSLAVEL